MTMRRALVLGASGIALLAALPARAQKRERPARIGWLSDGQPGPATALHWETFHKRFRELGHIEGRSYILEARWSRGETKRMLALAAELVALKPDVIVVITTPAALAVKQATTTIPVVASVADPVKFGLAKSLARPGGNFTGVVTLVTDIAGKLIELLLAIAPKTKSIAYVADTNNMAAADTFREMQTIAQSFGVAIKLFDGASASNVDGAFRTISTERIDGLIVSITQTVLQHGRQIVDSAARLALPAVYQREEYPRLGGLISYGADLGANYLRMAELADRILQGAQPADLPFEQASKFRMVLNLKTARALGLRVPQTIQVRADEVIE